MIFGGGNGWFVIGFDAKLLRPLVGLVENDSG